MTETKAVTAEQFASWMPIREALARATISFGAIAAHEIMEHLRGGVLIATAAKISLDQGDEDPLIQNIKPIAASLWSRLAAEDFWQTGTARFYLSDHYNLGEGPQTIRCFDIRLDPEAIQDTFPTPIDAAPASTSAGSPETIVGPGAEDGDAKKPPVSDALLKAWLEVYRQAYQGANDTLPTALASAKGMFPNKFVSRERVRALVGGRKSGRKRTSAD